jgi:hypothetical protein
MNDSTSLACSLSYKTAHGIYYHSCGAGIDTSTERDKVSLCAGAPEVIPEPASWTKTIESISINICPRVAGLRYLFLWSMKPCSRKLGLDTQGYRPICITKLST